MVNTSLKGQGGSQKLVVTLDGDRGVMIDQCASISRQLGNKIEELDLIEGKYNLEVSSAGMGSPLKLPRQYKKNQGRTLNVKLISGEEYNGKLGSSDDDGFSLETENGIVNLNFKDIDKSIVEVSFK